MKTKPSADQLGHFVAMVYQLIADVEHHNIEALLNAEDGGEVAEVESEVLDDIKAWLKEYQP